MYLQTSSIYCECVVSTAQWWTVAFPFLLTQCLKLVLLSILSLLWVYHSNTFLFSSPFLQCCVPVCLSLCVWLMFWQQLMQYMYLSVPVVHNGGLLFVCSYRYVMCSKAQTFGHSYFFFILKCGKSLKHFIKQHSGMLNSHWLVATNHFSHHS